MNVWYQRSLFALGAGALAVALTAVGTAAAPLAVILGSASIPLAMLFAVAGRVDSTPSGRALAGGGTIGVGIALLSHAVVFAFAYFFFLGFAEAGTAANLQRQAQAGRRQAPRPAARHPRRTAELRMSGGER